MKFFLKFLLMPTLALPGLSLAGACDGPKAEDTTCLRAEDVRLTLELNELHWKMVAASDGLRQGFLEMSKKAWTEYVKSQCVVEWDLSRVMYDEYSKAGSMASNDNLRCLIRLKTLRQLELRTVQVKSISKKK